jgi:hypothetical protein
VCPETEVVQEGDLGEAVDLGFINNLVRTGRYLASSCPAAKSSRLSTVHMSDRIQPACVVGEHCVHTYDPSNITHHSLNSVHDKGVGRAQKEDDEPQAHASKQRNPDERFVHAQDLAHLQNTEEAHDYYLGVFDSVLAVLVHVVRGSLVQQLRAVHGLHCSCALDVHAFVVEPAVDYHSQSESHDKPQVSKFQLIYEG